MGIELQDEDISTAHSLPTYNKSVEDKIIIKFTHRSIRDEFYGRGKQSPAKKLVKLALYGIFLKTQRRNYISPSR